MHFLLDLAALESEGRAFVLCTVTATQGSTPQKPGSRMAVLADGSLRGTIGGGGIEKQVIDAALALLANVESDTQTIETHLTHDLGMCCGGRMTVFLHKHQAAASLYIFGAGHVAKELALVAQQVGFRVCVVDERADWLTAERFPGARLCLEPPDEVAKSIRADAHTYCCVVTHDHPLDQACIEALVKIPLAYRGVIGSKRKALRFRQRMEAGGFSPAEIASFESPMGLPIDALTPAEIAVSVVARLIAVRRGRPAQR